jgi:hypothetical protein
VATASPCILSRINAVRRSTDRVRRPLRGSTMLDIVMLAIAAAFFAVSVGYAYACDRL